MINGILNIYKEADWTSFDVVAKLRSLTKQKKIGHTGTLDPAATGVLPVCFGKATKVCALLTDWDKTYETVFRPGIITDTQDMTGQVLERNRVDHTFDEMRRAILSFVGEYDQVPPMYSAKKKDGKKLYELARQGIEIERESVRVHIRDISDIRQEGEGVRFTVTCSKGTYIRTLCHDIGRTLSCGGCMESLLRKSVGPFDITGARKLSEIEQLLEKEGEEALLGILSGIDSLFWDLPSRRVKKEHVTLLRNGNPLRDEAFEDEAPEGYEGGIRVYDEDGSFAAIYDLDRAAQLYRVRRMFI